MKLFEFEAKAILKDHGFSVPRGRLVRSPAEAAETATEMGGPVVVKAQVLVSGRGKAGGITFASGPEDARDAAANLLGSQIKGNRVEGVLVEERLDIRQELFASVAVDTAAKSYVAIASAAGGIDIEATAAMDPSKVARRWYNPVAGLDRRVVQDITEHIGLAGDEARAFGKAIAELSGIALDKDAELVEVNPLARTASGGLVAADARIVVDDNSLFRHPELQGRSAQRADDSPLEAEARRHNLAYVDLSGSIGIIGNGAGLVMATLDLVNAFGGTPANFLDIGGGARPDVVKKSLLMVMSKPEVKAVLINILGGITRCDLVAEGVIAGLEEASVKKPVAIRMIGTNEEEGTRMLTDAGVHVYSSMEGAVKKALEAQALS